MTSQVYKDLVMIMIGTFVAILITKAVFGKPFYSMVDLTGTAILIIYGILVLKDTLKGGNYCVV